MTGFPRSEADGSASLRAFELFGDFDQHRIGPVLYWSWIPGGEGSHTHPFGRDRDSEVTLGVGTLFGLNDDTPTASLKLSMEVEF